MRKRHLCTTFKLKMNSFCRQRAGFEVLIKVTLKKKVRNQFLVKLFLLSFHLSAFEVTFIKASDSPLSRQKEFIPNLKVVLK